MTCDEIKALALEFAEGDLSADQSRSIEIHLHSCRTCATHVRETRALLGDLRAARGTPGQTEEVGRGDTVPPGALLEGHAVEAPRRLGDFELLEQIGAGGMGTVYRARQVTLNRIVALKVMRPAPGETATFLQRFRREAQAAAKLHHTNIVPVYAQGEAEGFVYYAMELIEGPSLAEVIRARATAGAERSLTRVGGRDFKPTARMFAEVAEGLAHAHEQGVIHRDIKAQNLLRDHAGRLHITDFGLARVIAEPGLTLTSEMMGTPAYMAPEQITHGGKAVDGRCDVWALGVTLYEYLTGEKPFAGDTAQQIIHRILREDPRHPRRLDGHIPIDLETICLRALEKEPSRRFATAADFAADLRRFAGDYSIQSRRIGPLGRAVRWCRRNPAKATAIGAAALIAALTPVTVGLFQSSANARIERALDVLFNDYHDAGAALQALGWAKEHGGNRGAAQLAALWSELDGDAPRCARDLAAAIAQRPGTADLSYLLAWAEARLAALESPEHWPRMRQRVAEGDAHSGTATAAGWFFRGQALLAIDPNESIRSFDEALAKRLNFTQALLHQARAGNQFMYLKRDDKEYGRTQSGLEMVRKQQPGRAYPRYLLARAHTLAGEIYAARGAPGDAEKAAAAFEGALAAARDAQQAEKSSPRGFIAEAQCLESMGKPAEALQVYELFGRANVPIAKRELGDLSASAMRVAFAIGNYDAAEKYRALRYGPQSGYSAAAYDPDETFYQALILASRGDLEAARKALAAASAANKLASEEALRLSAGAALVGLGLPANGAAERGHELPLGWSPDWLEAARKLAAGQISWETTAQVIAAHETSVIPDQRQFLTSAGAWFGGLHALANGRRADALEFFARGAAAHDNEDYCFRSRLMEMRMRADAAWPAWIAAR